MKYNIGDLLIWNNNHEKKTTSTIIEVKPDEFLVLYKLLTNYSDGHSTRETIEEEDLKLALNLKDIEVLRIIE